MDAEEKKLKEAELKAAQIARELEKQKPKTVKV
jgi:hypothetical protein